MFGVWDSLCNECLNISLGFVEVKGSKRAIKD